MVIRIRKTRGIYFFAKHQPPVVRRFPLFRDFNVNVTLRLRVPSARIGKENIHGGGKSFDFP